jgi:phospholipid N-methyltransferase
MYGNLDFSETKVVVELGSGKGVFTHEILKLIGPECKLLTFEVNKSFCEKTKIRDLR